MRATLKKQLVKNYARSSRETTITVECKITIQSKIILDVYKIEGNNRFYNNSKSTRDIKAQVECKIILIVLKILPWLSVERES